MEVIHSKYMNKFTLPKDLKQGTNLDQLRNSKSETCKNLKQEIATLKHLNYIIYIIVES